MTALNEAELRYLCRYPQPCGWCGGLVEDETAWVEHKWAACKGYGPPPDTWTIAERIRYGLMVQAACDG